MRVGDFFYDIHEKNIENSYLLALESNLANNIFESSLLVAGKIKNSYFFEKIKEV